MKRRSVSLLLAAVMTISLTGCGSMSEMAGSAQDAVSSAVGTVSEKLGFSSEETETELAEGQRKATIQVVSITGNELTYIEETEEEAEEETETETGTEVETGAETETETETETEVETAVDAEAVASDEQQGDNSASGNMPDTGDFGSENMLDMSDANGENDDAEVEATDTETSDQETADTDIAAETESGTLRTESDSETEAETGSAENIEESSGRGGMRGGGQMGGNMDMSDVNMGDIDMSDVAEAFADSDIDMDSIADAFSSGDVDISDVAEAFGSGDVDMSDIADVMSGDTDLSELVGETEQETTTVYLQVGVTVYTSTGKEKTFSILEAGDELEVLFETDADGNEVITTIWIVSTE